MSLSVNKLREHHAFSYMAYTLHDRAGTLASLLYKAEKPSVCPPAFFPRQAANSAVSTSIDFRLA